MIVLHLLDVEGVSDRLELVLVIPDIGEGSFGVHSLGHPLRQFVLGVLDQLPLLLQQGFPIPDWERQGLYPVLDL